MSAAFFNEMTQEELADYARVYGDNDDGSVPRSEISWAFDPDFDVSRLLSIMSAEEWKTWIEEEIEMSVVELDDPDRWAPLLEQDILEPTVIFDHPDGNLRIWDGWHRSGSAVVKGAQTMKVVYGTAPGYIPRPR
ncbi:hypothetical protein D3C71_420490 [compost metagenome]